MLCRASLFLFAHVQHFAYTVCMTGPFDFSGTVLKANMDTFAQTVTHTPQEGIAYVTRGVFDEAYTELVVIDGEAVTVKMPVLGIKIDEWPIYPSQGDMVTVSGSLVFAGTKLFVIREVRPDSHGGVKLMLNKYDPGSD